MLIKPKNSIRMERKNARRLMARQALPADSLLDIVAAEIHPAVKKSFKLEFHFK